MRWFVGFVTLLLVSFSALTTGWCQTVTEATIAGSINPAAATLLAQAVAAAKSNGSALLIVRLDTPGGTVSAMRQMVQTMLDTSLPIAIYVAPAGARATSAGVFLVAAADIAAMHPQTTIGAATPISMLGGDTESAAQKKALNDAVSLISTLAKAKRKNLQWYLSAVEDAVSIDAEQARTLGVIDLIATDIQQIVSKAIALQIMDQPSADQPLRVITFDPGWRYTLFSWLLDPQIAILMLMLAAMGILTEMSSPGLIFPGVIGVICGLLGLYAFSIIPHSTTGMLLIALAAIFLILEINVTSFGLLTLASAIAFFLGASLLFEEHQITLAESWMFYILYGLIFILMTIVVWKLVRAQGSQPKQALLGLEGYYGEVIEWHGHKGTILVRGERWHAESADSQPLLVGERVRVIRNKGLVLIVSR